MKKNQKTKATTTGNFKPVDLKARIKNRKRLVGTTYVDDLIKSGITVIFGRTLLPTYLALKISKGEKPFGVVQTTQADVGLFCSSKLSGETIDLIDDVSTSEIEAEFAVIEEFEDFFWGNPQQLLDHVKDAKFVVVELTEESKFATMTAQFNALNEEAKSIGVAIVLACSWDAVPECGFPQLQVTGDVVDGFTMHMLNVQGNPMQLKYQWDELKQDFQLLALAGFRKSKAIAIGFFSLMGYTNAQIALKADASPVTVTSYLSKLEPKPTPA